MTHHQKSYLYLLIVSIIWGVAGPIIKYTLSDFPPVIFLTYRFMISTLIAILIFAKKRPHIPKDPNIREHLAFYGFLISTVSLGLLFFGFEKTTALSGSLLSALTPIMVVAAGAYFLHDRITNIEHIGIGVAFVGTALTVIEPLITGGTQLFSASLEGNLLIMASLLVGVITAIQGKYLLRDKIDPQTLTHLSFIVGFLTMIPVLLLSFSLTEVWTIFTHAPLLSHVGVWYMALMSGTLAYTLWHIGQKSIEVSEAALFNYLLPLWATPVAMLWLGEKATPIFWVGSIIIAVGVGIAEYKKRLPSPSHGHRHEG